MPVSSPPSSATAPPTIEPSIDARLELEQTLQDLKKHAANYVNLSRLHLALLGLSQPAGEESIRVAVLGVANGNRSGNTAKSVLELLLVDPLKEKEEWERQLAQRRPGLPVIVKVGRRDVPGTGVIERKGMFEEVHVSSPVYDGYNLELLLMDVNAPSAEEDASIEEQLLNLPVDIASNTGKFSPIMTPVHKALLVADGITGVRSVTSIPANDENSVIHSAINIPRYNPPKDADLPFQPIDVTQAQEGVELFRKDLKHAMDYERLWFQSNLPAIADWLKTGIEQQPGTTKPAVRQLIASVLQETASSVEAAESRLLGGRLRLATQSPSTIALQRSLSQWAQSAHGELQEQLDLAFTGQRWRKLGWWKLFWRVDDVTMLTNDMLNQQFLPTAEKNLVYLSGQVRGAIAAAAPSAVLIYPQPTPSSSAVVPLRRETRWPTHVSFTRRYLQEETIPALQALAQKLVLQCYTTCGLTTSLAGLLYVSTWTSSIYEAGAVAALGAVWSLRRLQKKWGAARDFWEGEVREEGRKAVRAAEESMAEALEGESRSKGVIEGEEEFEKVRELVAKAEDALARMK
ncbi:Uncharacterized protein SAPIO_CDS9717 [Scedosporium apiospermum]|uniref:Mmc1 C-terminal domain-containing protein n=1 Tax=Pseudallescheria apiosperma TaxID=563466 RepID=A0A084FXE5_PSEDA|nr:Uncharacterized protein SAPIO_CDS9717 [Scedosporium apiospermum]KEZ39757.1 Uncharacterized protein SAPIO_CDS9717 [Scedosporium apiospermum]